MGNVASLELCKELYELTGGEKALRSWHNTPFAWADVAIEHKPPAKPIWEPRVVPNNFQALCDFVPAYDLGYLLRKLPDHVRIYKNIEPSKRATNTAKADWYRAFLPFHASATADTSEDAACKLAIELFKQGILKKEPV